MTLMSAIRYRRVGAGAGLYHAMIRSLGFCHDHNNSIVFIAFIVYLRLWSSSFQSKPSV